MKKRRWLRVALIAVVFLLAADWGLSIALRGGWARRSLLARVSSSFGRPVDVGHFDVSLSPLSGPTLEADRITVAEDPRFGEEYFLRAEQLTVSVRWWALLRGRFEFATLAFSQPSLNVVRAADGRWNIESWLPSTALSSPSDTSSTRRVAPALRLARIEIDGGRINFKRATEKLPFALVGVTGSLERDAAGRWSIDLEAHPTRAPVAIQEAGTWHVRGTVGGTSARLRPASLQVSWDQASLADVLRLALGSDHGMRGSVAAELSASVADAPLAPAGAGSAWQITGALRMAGMHRWDMPGRDSDPAANLTATAQWQPGTSRVDVTQCVVEAPHSRLGATAEFDWSHGPEPSVRLVSTRIGIADLLAWRRAFLPGVAEDLSAEGTVGVDANLAGWPLRIEQAAVASTGAVLRTALLPGPIRIGRVQAALRNGSLQLDPATVTLPGTPEHVGAARNAATVESAPAGTLRVEGALGPLRTGASPHDWPYRVTVSGQTQRAQDLLVLAAAFGGPPAGNWSAIGGVTLQLRWAGALRHGTSTTAGTIGLRNLRFATAVLNQPLDISSASIDLRPGERHVKIAEAQAFGAKWRGTLDRRAAGLPWTFDLAADALDVAEVDRWLSPRAQPGFFERMLPFAQAGGQAPSREAALAVVAARGRLRVDELILAPVRVEKFDAQVDLAGRTLSLREVQAELYGGRLTGQFDANLSADPEYAFRGQIDRANLATLAEPARLPARFAGTASGELTLRAHGLGRQSLLATLGGEGALRIRDLAVRDWSVAAGKDANWPAAAPFDGRFSSGKAGFRVAGGRIILDQFSVADRGEQVDVEGSVDFARHLDLHIRDSRLGPVPRNAAVAPDVDPDAEHPTWMVAGTLDAPQVSRPTRVAVGVEANRAAPGPVPRR